MKRNLMNLGSSERIITRVLLLDEGAKPLWGKMNASEMLMHCNSCNREIFERERGNKKTNFKQYLLRILALYIAPNFKKGLSSEPHHITKGKAVHLNFEEIRKEFIELINRFPENRQPLTLTHPAFGNISTNQWGIAAYKHMDHHLRQFGV